MKKTASLLGIAVLGGMITLGGYKYLFEKSPIVIEKAAQTVLPTIQASFNPTNRAEASSSIDFTAAADRTVHAVVHVKNTSIRTQQNPWAEFMFGSGNGIRKYEQVGTGSGVIITMDGYIVTNNHVIDGASDLEVTLNNQKKYKAKLIGTDADNDIALLKIDADIKLPYIPFANSDAIKVGEWVLAVGNPYNLTSTVTAGIVSAKGRDLQGNSNVDSFIQTDAAVNPGNSGGALVNTRGELIGINTAISSRTGSFIGYSFAVPSNIAKKVVEDLIEFGRVQEAVIGIGVDLNFKDEGVKIGSLTDESSAKKSGLKEGDIIKSVNNISIAKFADLTGQLRAKRPGDYVEVVIDRNGKELTKKVQLSKKDRFQSVNYNLELRDLTAKEKKKLGISYGVKITNDLSSRREGSIKGYIIAKINGKKVIDASSTQKFLDSNTNPMTVDMINLDGKIEKYYIR
ncbi:serine protease [Polaribacter pacificus]|uniref:Serine protease n=1 Tax=Polaribacter pacificus TaxID=1775173 RepID=A0A917I0S2_9FLAO|nr:trypsin-like peptidase domain-containing protein [Polaribacter pacificus]GGH00362.1 serine protease [Polaribacter pacificus]